MANPIVRYQTGRLTAYSGTSNGDVLTWDSSLAEWKGTSILPAVNGGTGQSSYVVGDILYASTTTALSKLADVATGNALISGGVGVAPSYGKIGLTTHITGTLGVGNGGTGITTTPTGGQVVYGDTTGAYALLANGTSGRFLQASGSTAAPVWASVPYDVAGSIAGQPAGGATVFLFKATRAFTLASAASSHAFRALTGATSSSAFTVYLNTTGTTIMTATFAAGGQQNATITPTTITNTAIAIGDVIFIVAPPTADATLANIFWTLTGVTP